MTTGTKLREGNCFANSFPQMGPNTAQPSSSADHRPQTNQDRLAQAIADRYINLHQVIKSFASEEGVGDTLELLTEVTYGWLCEAVGFDREASPTPERDYPIRLYHLEALYSTFRLMVFVANVKDTWDQIESLEARQEKEVNNG